MNLRQYLSTMIFATLLCWVAWFFVLFNVDPFETNTLGFGFFYLSFGLALMGTISIILFCVYRAFGGQDIPLFRYVQKSFREAVILALFLTVFLWLRGANYLTALTSILLTLVLILIISFTISVPPRTHEIEFKSPYS